MMPRIYLFLILAALPLGAQTSMDDRGKMNPDQAPGIAPATPNGAIILQPGINAPPPGAPLVLPERPAEPVIIPKIAEFIVTPGTVREVQLSKYQLLTTIRLNVPSTKDMVCHVVSSDPKRVIATDIKFIKGQRESSGGIRVNWKNIQHNMAIGFKAFDAEHPEAIFYGRLYIRKVNLDPAP